MKATATVASSSLRATISIIGKEKHHQHLVWLYMRWIWRNVVASHTDVRIQFFIIVTIEILGIFYNFFYLMSSKYQKTNQLN
jgi:hypothetical protein